MDLNETYFFYGYSAAWIIVFGLIVLMVRRSQRLERELSRLKTLVHDKER